MSMLGQVLDAFKVAKLKRHDRPHQTGRIVSVSIGRAVKRHLFADRAVYLNLLTVSGANPLTLGGVPVKDMDVSPCVIRFEIQYGAPSRIKADPGWTHMPGNVYLDVHFTGCDE
jgi:hypothetical protein